MSKEIISSFEHNGANYEVEVETDNRGFRARVLDESGNIADNMAVSVSFGTADKIEMDYSIDDIKFKAKDQLADVAKRIFKAIKAVNKK